jgi:hypothetical protein
VSLAEFESGRFFLAPLANSGFPLPGTVPIDMLAELAPKLYTGNERFHLVKVSQSFKGLPEGQEEITGLVIIYLKAGEQYNLASDDGRTELRDVAIAADEVAPAVDVAIGAAAEAPDVALVSNRIVNDFVNGVGTTNYTPVAGSLDTSHRLGVSDATITDAVEREVIASLGRGELQANQRQFTDELIRLSAIEQITAETVSQLLQAFGAVVPQSGFTGLFVEISTIINQFASDLGKLGVTDAELNEQTEVLARQLVAALKTIKAGTKAEFQIPLDTLGNDEALQDLVGAALYVITILDVDLHLVAEKDRKEVVRARNRLLTQKISSGINVNQRLLIGSRPTDGEVAVRVTGQPSLYLSQLESTDIIASNTWGNNKTVVFSKDTKLASHFMIAMLAQLTREQVSDLFQVRNGVLHVKSRSALNVVALALHIITQEAQAEFARLKAA